MLELLPDGLFVVVLAATAAMLVWNARRGRGRRGPGA